MKNLALIYNPYAGDKSFKFALDACINIFQEAGYCVQVFRSMKPGDIESFSSGLDAKCDAVVVSGGDGTINQVVNGLMKANLNVPLGIIPSGTANDFASYLHLQSQNVEKACEVIAKGKKMKVDIGLVNDRYFINVCGGGLLTNVSQNIDTDFKNIMGKMAYYIDGIKQLPNFYPIPLRITHGETVIEEEVYFFLVLNSSGAGSFSLAKEAKIQDGKFDFLAVRAQSHLVDLAKLFVSVLKGEHLQDPNVIYFQDEDFLVEDLSKDQKFSETDIDGERGPVMPVSIKVLPKALDLFIP